MERTLTLSTEKRGAKGQIEIRMVFQPEIIMRTRKSTSTFSAAGRTMTAIGTAPISAGRGVLQGVAGVFKRGQEDGPNVFGLGSVPESKVVPDIPRTQVSQPVTDGEHVVPVVSSGKAVLQGVASVFKRGHSEDGHNVSGLGTVPESKVIPDISGTQVSQPVTDGEHVVPVVSSGTNGQSTSTDPGILRVSVLDAKDLIGGQDVKPYAVVRVGEKEFKTKHAGKTVVPEWCVYSWAFELHLFALGMRPLISPLDLQPPSSMSQSLITRLLERIRRWGTQTLMSVTNMYLYSAKS